MTDLICIDWESAYSQDYSLSKLTTEAYIRHSDFEVIGVSVKRNYQPAVWFSGTKAEIKQWLGQWDIPNSICVAHNAMFDMAILNWHFDIRPKRIGDTLSMARALLGGKVSVSLASLAKHYGLGVKGTAVVNAKGKWRRDFSSQELAEYGEYCRNDTELCHDLFMVLAQGYPLDELKLIDLTIRMFTEPQIELDSIVLTEHLRQVKNQKELLLSAVEATKTDLMSNDKFAEILRRMGIDPPTKTSPNTGKEIYAFAKTDEGMKALQEYPDIAVQALVAARLNSKSTLEETRTERFLDISKRGAFPVPLSYCAAQTLRYAGCDSINLQNIPRKSLLKNAMRAPEGYVFLESDLSAVEARVLAWLAGQDDLVAGFEAKALIYEGMAADIYNVDVSTIKPKSKERQAGKTTILQAGYGSGGPKLKNTLRIAEMPVIVTDELADHIIRTYRNKYPMIPKLWKQAEKVIEAMAQDCAAPVGREGVFSVEGKEGILTPCGLRLRYENLRKHTFRDGKTGWAYDVKKGPSLIPTKIYGAALVGHLCQHLARVIIGEQMLRISQRYKVALTVHDSIGCVVPKDEAEWAKEWISMNMRTRPDWAMDLPLDCEAGYGASYGDC